MTSRIFSSRTRVSRSVRLVGCLAGLLAACAHQGERATGGSNGAIQVTQTQVEYLDNPIGIDTPRPRISWILAATKRGQQQAAYRILVASSQAALDRGEGDLWDSGRVASDAQTLIRYDGKPMQSRQRAHYRMQVWDQDGAASPWSDTGLWEMGLLSPTDWQARWIGTPGPMPKDTLAEEMAAAAWIWFPVGDKKSVPKGVWFLRGSFDVPAGAPIESARLLVGINEVATIYINGRHVGASTMETAENYLDVTSALLPGRNSIAVEVGNDGGTAGFLCRLQLHHKDASRHTVLVTDESWRAADRGDRDWQSRSFNDTAWKPVRKIAAFGEAPFATMPHRPASEAPAPMLRRTFTLKEKPRSARVYLTGLGYYDLYINGKRVGDQVLDPAFTDFSKRIQYVTHDVTQHLVAGSNTIGVILGSGFFHTHAWDVWDFQHAPWRNTPRLRLQLEADVAGQTQTVATDPSWQLGTGPITFQGIRNGETFDARRDDPDWATPGGDAGDAGTWAKASLVDPPRGKVVARMHPPIRVTETLKAKSVNEPAPGVHVFDLGQNIAGWARLRVQGPAGTKVVLKYGESLTADGRVEQKPLAHLVSQGTFQTDTYILRGAGVETWEPRFTYHGFRWVEVTGLPEKPSAEAIEGRVVHTDFQSAGSFESGSALINQIQKLTRWSYRGNFHGIPTDCPHREKNGWTGDAHLAIETGMFNFANTAAYNKWIDDLLDSQSDAGDLPGIVPSSGWGFGKWSGPSWEAALFEVPWALYRFHGDIDILKRVYPAWVRHLAYLERNDKDHLIEFGLGDWVPFLTSTPPVITSTGYFFRFAELAAHVAALLGHERDAGRFRETAEHVRTAFHKHFVDGRENSVASDEDAALATALFHGILTPEESVGVARHLADKVTARKFHFDAGVIGAKYALRMLDKYGYTDVAYRTATATDIPSWGHWVMLDATTLWESWEGGASLNHIFFGDISAWFYEVLAGIRPDDSGPGFARVVIRPHAPADLPFVRATHQSPRGPITSAWKREGAGVRYQIDIPANVVATVSLAAQAPDRVREGDVIAAEAPGVAVLAGVKEAGRVAFTVGSGHYEFFVTE